MGVVGGLDDKTICTFKLLNNKLQKLGKVNMISSVKNKLGKLGNSLSISLRLKNVALGLKEGLDLTVVGNDTIVDNIKFVVNVTALRVAVNSLRLTVGGPSRVRDTNVILENFILVRVGFIDCVLQSLDLANLAENKDITALSRGERTFPSTARPAES